MTEYLDLEDLLAIADDAIDGRVLVADHGLLQSALARPQASVFGQDAYPDLHLKAAALLHSLVSNHALVDGNKRLAWLATFVFLDINDKRVMASQSEVVDFVVAIASSELSDLDKIAERLSFWTSR